MSKIAVYPGTFDPVTLGHLDVVRRAQRLFDHVIVAVSAIQTDKQVLFSVEERLDLFRAALGEHSDVIVESFDGLLVDYVRARGACVVIRGLRAFSDFEYEFKMVLTNQKLDPEFETVFFMPSHDCVYINSHLVREIAALGGPVEAFVPQVVAARLQARVLQPRVVPTTRQQRQT